MHIKLLNGNSNLAKVLAAPLVLVSLLDLVQLEHLLVDDGLELLDIGFNCTTHVLHKHARTDENTANDALVHQTLEESGLICCGAANEADDGNDTLDANSFQALLYGRGASNFDDVVDTQSTCQLLGLLAPVWCVLVVDDVVCAEFLEHLGLFGRRCSSNDFGTCGLGELETENADTTRSLSKNPLARKKLLALQAVKGVPGSQAGASERGAFDVVEALGERHKSLLVECAEVAKSAVVGSTKTSACGGWVGGTTDMCLIEEGHDVVARLEAGDLLAYCDDGTGAV